MEAPLLEWYSWASWKRQWHDGTKGMIRSQECHGWMLSCLWLNTNRVRIWCRTHGRSLLKHAVIGYISRVERCIMSQFASTFCSYRAFHLHTYDTWILTCGGGRSLSPSALTAEYKKTIEFLMAHKKREMENMAGLSVQILIVDTSWWYINNYIFCLVLNWPSNFDNAHQW